jgi:small GTP-binding protein
MTVQGRTVDLAIWDTAGQEVFRALAPQYFRDASMAIIVFSVTEQESLDGAEYWIKSVQDSTPTALLILAGNKVDATPRVIDFDRANEFAEAREIPYVETSALTGQAVGTLFELIVERFLQQHTCAPTSESPDGPPVAAVVLTPAVDESHHSKCC